jgi:cytochrome c peroxidase
LKINVVIVWVAVLVLFSCKKKEIEIPRYEKPQVEEDTSEKYLNLPERFFNYEPGGLPLYSGIEVLLLQDKLNPDNPLTNAGATLGRVLFYDKALSKNFTISCSSCHIQKFGFSDTAKLSTGFNGEKTKRHSMALANARFRHSGIYFWDGRANSLEQQVLMPIQDPVEMGMTLSDLERRIDSIPYYNELFNQAFGSSEVSSTKISYALAQFVRSINSFNSKYDEGRLLHKHDEDFSNFSQLENEGKRLFHNVNKGNCGGCHFTDAMVNDIPRNNGLTNSEFGIDDEGYFLVSKNPNDLGAFMAPSLRNIAIRPPYMHNGAFKDLRSVVEAYSTQIAYSPSLDAHLKIGGKAVRFNLTETEVNALVAFLNTLTDYELINDVKYSDPFIR